MRKEINSMKKQIEKKREEWILLSQRSLPHHPYHMVSQSPWPYSLSWVLFCLTTSTVLTFQGYPMGSWLLCNSLLLLVWGMSLWFKDIIAEASYLGYHTDKVQKGLSLGVVMFIISEAFFFLSIFWAYFHSALGPTIEIGAEWPPKAIEPLNAGEVPAANTAILLSSGSSVTAAHHALVDQLLVWAEYGFVSTTGLGGLFTGLQGLEYIQAPFTFADGIYGSVFFLGTGFHGFHVIIGTIFLVVGGVRIIAYHVTSTHHVGVESGILYWHFVDVVWLFLYGGIYFWGGTASTVAYPLH